MKSVVFRLVVPLGLGLMIGMPVSADPLGTAFSYQGTLADPQGPVDGVRDLRVTLFDAAAQGSIVGGPIAFEDVPILDGHLSLELDFGAVFTGAPMWLSFEIRDGASDGGYTLLTPRQKLRAVPFSAHATNVEFALAADTADTAVTADTLDGLSGSGYLDWTNLTGVPDGLGDGDDDALQGLSCTPGQIPVWGSGGWECGTEAGPRYGSITVVGPVGNAETNGAALLAAMASIAEPASVEDAHLLLIEPGVYDLGSGMLSGKPWVDIAGAGRNVTVVTSSVCDAGVAFNVGTVLMAGDETLRDLEVTNTCSNENAHAVTIPVDADRARLSRVTAIASGGPTSFRVVAVNGGGDFSNLTEVSAQAGGGTSSNLAIVMAGDFGRLSDCVATASGGAWAGGAWFGGSSAPPESTTWVDRCSFQASGAATAVGLELNQASMDLRRSSATGPLSLQIANDSGVNTARISQFTGTGTVEVFAGSGSVDVFFEQSRVVATGPTVDIRTSGVVMRIAATQLWGGAITGTASCAGVWDENWTFYTNTCP